MKEIVITDPFSTGDEFINTIYFGGGTPSLLSSHELRLVMEALQQKFSIASNAEITLEANPDDIHPVALQQWASSGINRLSVGIQTFSEDELRWMNRAHTAVDSVQCIHAIQQAGFTNFSIDLIYGSPLLTDEAWEKHAALVFQQNVPHISCYALTIEPKTPLSKMVAQQKTPGTDPEKQARQFLLLMQWMRQAGYEHYEISNFALPGYRSRHNSSYWEGEKYYGFGPSAHSFNGHKRKWNIANNALYIRSLQNNLIPAEEETLTPVQRLNEYIMTSLRTMEGLRLDIVHEKFGAANADQLLHAAKKWQSGGKLLLVESTLVLTDEGKLFADGIAADLFV